ncbi:hypothetical protein [Streptomyces sp. NPDC058678]|uniref:hypothetical protein n=1 Tax=Streptomyces sp. NPDC058678 TaxID=3346595 RepID=UPI003661EEF4
MLRRPSRRAPAPGAPTVWRKRLTLTDDAILIRRAGRGGRPVDLSTWAVHLAPGTRWHPAARADPDPVTALTSA